MSPSHASKGAKRYRYYLTHAAELEAGDPPAWRVPAHDLETIVTDRVAAMLRDRREMRRLADMGDGSAMTLQRVIQAGRELADDLATPAQRRDLIGKLVRRVAVRDDHVSIVVDEPALLELLRVSAAQPADPTDTDLHLTAPAVRQRVGKEVRLVIPAADDGETARDDKLVALLAEALHVRELLIANPDQTIEQMARDTGRCRSRTARLLRLAFVAPDVIERVLDGDPAPQLARKGLSAVLPLCWRAQSGSLMAGG